jgi:hypothetical protein
VNANIKIMIMNTNLDKKLETKDIENILLASLMENDDMFIHVMRLITNPTKNNKHNVAANTGTLFRYMVRSAVFVNKIDIFIKMISAMSRLHLIKNETNVSLLLSRLQYLSTSVVTLLINPSSEEYKPDMDVIEQLLKTCLTKIRNITSGHPNILSRYDDLIETLVSFYNKKSSSRYKFNKKDLVNIFAYCPLSATSIVIKDPTILTDNYKYLYDGMTRKYKTSGYNHPYKSFRLISECNYKSYKSMRYYSLVHPLNFVKNDCQLLRDILSIKFDTHYHNHFVDRLSAIWPRYYRYRIPMSHLLKDQMIIERLNINGDESEHFCVNCLNYDNVIENLCGYHNYCMDCIGDPSFTYTSCTVCKNLLNNYSALNKIIDEL